MSDEIILSQVKEVTSLARSTWISLAVVCVFCWLVIFEQNDDVLFNNSDVVELPIVGAEVAPLAFNVSAAGIVAALTIYVHILIIRLLNRPLFAGDPEVRILGHGKDEERNTLSRGTAH